jgi:hypothetical protein
MKLLRQRLQRRDARCDGIFSRKRCSADASGLQICTIS